MSEKIEYIYLIRTKEYVERDEPVYKIGRTSRQPQQRFKEYDDGYEVYLTLAVSNSTKVESQVITHFKNKYRRFSKLEYFEGELRSMYSDIFMICYLHGEIGNLEPTAIIESDPYSTPTNLRVKKRAKSSGVLESTSTIITNSEDRFRDSINRDLCIFLSEKIKSMRNVSPKMNIALTNISNHTEVITSYNQALEIDSVGTVIAKLIEDEYLTNDIILSNIAKSNDLDIYIALIPCALSMRDLWFEMDVTSNFSREEISKLSLEHMQEFDDFVVKCVKKHNTIKLYNKYNASAGRFIMKYPLQSNLFYLSRNAREEYLPKSTISYTSSAYDDISKELYSLILKYKIVYNFTGLSIESVDLEDVKLLAKILKVNIGTSRRSTSILEKINTELKLNISSRSESISLLKHLTTLVEYVNE